MRITFLGTGTSQGVPVIACSCRVCRSQDPKDKRLRSSVMVSVDDRNIIIDTGPDFREQMLRGNISKLDAVLITHEHRDHIAGLDDIRAYNFIHRKPMDVYGEERVIRALQYGFPYIFAERKYPGVPQVITHVIENQLFSINQIDILPVRAFHYRLPVFGFRIGNFGYLTDANRISAEEKSKLKGLHALVVCALRKKEHISHFTLSEAVDLISELKPERAYLTHISHQMGPHAEVQSELPGHVFLAHDGLILEI